MLHFMSIVAAILVIALITTQFAAYQSFRVGGGDPTTIGSMPARERDPLGTPGQGRKVKDLPVSDGRTGKGVSSRSQSGAKSSSDVKSHSSRNAQQSAGENSAGSDGRSRRVALAFYGLTRSLQYTIGAIRENIFDKLAQAGYEYDVYLHTYNLADLQNERSGESAHLNTTEWKLLSPDFVEIANQDLFLEEYKLAIKACETFSYHGITSASAVDYYEDNFKSVQNLMCQLNSIQSITSMWRASGIQYDAVAYLRPDVLYNCPFPTHLLDNLRSDAVYIADFHHWHGYNDRFAMGRPEAVGLWGERLQFALSTCMRQQVHAETLVSTLLDHYQLAAELIPYYFFRVRSTGLLEDRDFKPKWKSWTIPQCDKAMFKPFVARAKLAEDKEIAQEKAAERKSAGKRAVSTTASTKQAAQESGRDGVLAEVVSDEYHDGQEEQQLQGEEE